MVPIQTPISPTTRRLVAGSATHAHSYSRALENRQNRSRTIGASGRPTTLLTFALNLSLDRLRHLVAHKRR
jgi:hypothetical protein